MSGRLINMILRQLVRRGVNEGVDAVMRRRAAKSGEGSDAPRHKGVGGADSGGKDAARRARQMMRMTRRISRF